MPHDEAAHQQRLALEAQTVGVCTECRGFVTELDRFCRNEIRLPSGDSHTTYMHASCIGCECSEYVRWVGCGMCERKRL